jgi:hypothetical protein
METRSLQGLTLYYDAEEQEAADLIGRACARSLPLIEAHWGLERPEDLRVYVMTSWLRPILHSAQWSWRILLAVTLPLWGLRARRLWRIAGGWEQAFGQRRTVGVKPPWLLQEADGSLGSRIFVPGRDLDQRVEHNTCHELAHAFVTHLKLPAWLKEGHAMVTVDRYAGEPTVQDGTLETLARSSAQPGAGHTRQLETRDPAALVYQCVQGYWITRMLDEMQPDLLRNLLQERITPQVLESRLAAGLGLQRQELWDRIDSVVIAHFQRMGLSSSSEGL